MTLIIMKSGFTYGPLVQCLSMLSNAESKYAAKWRLHRKFIDFVGN